MTYFVLIFSILIWPFGQLLAFQIPGLPFTLYLLDPVVGLLTVSLLIHKNSREKIFQDKIFLPLISFLGVAALSLLFNLPFLLSGNVLYPLLYLVRLIIYPSLYFATRQFPIKKILPYIVVSLMAFCIFGFFQYLFMPDMRFLKLLGFDDHYYRLIGTFYDPNFTGAILSALSLALFSLNFFVPGIISIILLALTFSRAAFLSFGLGIIYLLISKKKYPLLLLLLVFAIIIYLIPKPFGEGVNLLRTVSIFSRFESWKSGLLLFIERPILGYGFNTLRNITGDRYQIDNSYIFLLATTGIFGLGSFIYLLKEIFKKITLTQKLFLGSLLVHSFFNNSLFFIWISFAFWLAAGMEIKEYKQS